jgi:hypothetical protein
MPEFLDDLFGLAGFFRTVDYDICTRCFQGLNLVDESII